MDNALKSSEDNRDWIFENLVHGPVEYYNDLPDSFTLEKFDAPCRHQGNRGTCGPFAATKISEINHHKRTNDTTKWIYLSPEFIYFHRANRPLAGMYGRDVFQVLRKYGTVPEDQYPYAHSDNIVAAPGVELYKTASSHRISNYARVKTIDGLKRAIIEIGPCYIGLPMYNHTEKFWDVAYGHNFDIGHAVSAIGYTPEGFIIKNSWGDNWGNSGRTIFPYSDFNVHWEIWAPISRE
jgi:hypothetical protein